MTQADDSQPLQEDTTPERDGQEESRALDEDLLTAEEWLGLRREQHASMSTMAKRQRAHRRKWYEPTPFLDLPRSKRRDMAASMGWRIQSNPNGGGLFVTNQILPGDRERPLFDLSGHRDLSLWAHFYFKSQRPLRDGVFFYATANTVTKVAVEALLKLAEDHVNGLLTEEERKPNLDLFRYKRLPNGNWQQRQTLAYPTFESLGGLTKDGAKAVWLRQHWHELESLVSLSPVAGLDYSYPRGIRVEFVVDLDTVDRQTIPVIIERFRQKGEQGYIDEPVDLTRYGKRLRELLEVHLWHMDRIQTQAEGKPGPEQPREEVVRVADYQSQPIRWYRR